MGWGCGDGVLGVCACAVCMCVLSFLSSLPPFLPRLSLSLPPSLPFPPSLSPSLPFPPSLPPSLSLSPSLPPSAQVEIQQLKDKISSQSKENFKKEKDLRYLDSKIALLINHKISADVSGGVTSLIRTLLSMVS